MKFTNELHALKECVRLFLSGKFPGTGFRPYGDFFKQFGGETQDELTERVVKTMTDIMENAKGENVLVVSHGAACANFIRSFEQYNVAHYKRGIRNCGIFRCSYENGIFSCLEIVNHDFSSFM